MFKLTCNREWLSVPQRNRDSQKFSPLREKRAIGSGINLSPFDVGVDRDVRATQL